MTAGLREYQNVGWMVWLQYEIHWQRSVCLKEEEEEEERHTKEKKGLTMMLPTLTTNTNSRWLTVSSREAPQSSR